MKLEDYDAVVVLTCKRHHARLDSIRRECDRMGLSRMIQFGISFGEPDAQSNTAGVFFNMLKHGAQRVLILEDDVRFLKDVDRARRIIESAPCQDCDAVFFDIFPHWKDEILKCVLECRDKGVVFMGMTGGVYGASCYSVNARYMAHFLEVYKQKPNEPPDSSWHTRNGVRSVFSLNPPCVQVLYKDANNLRWGNAQHDAYSRWGVRYEDYNVEDGYDYGKVLEV